MWVKYYKRWFAYETEVLLQFIDKWNWYDSSVINGMKASLAKADPEIVPLLKEA